MMHRDIHYCRIHLNNARTGGITFTIWTLSSRVSTTSISSMGCCVWCSSRRLKSFVSFSSFGSPPSFVTASTTITSSLGSIRMAPKRRLWAHSNSAIYATVQLVPIYSGACFSSLRRPMGWSNRGSCWIGSCRLSTSKTFITMRWALHPISLSTTRGCRSSRNCSRHRNWIKCAFTRRSWPSLTFTIGFCATKTTWLASSTRTYFRCSIRRRFWATRFSSRRVWNSILNGCSLAPTSPTHGRRSALFT